MDLINIWSNLLAANATNSGIHLGNVNRVCNVQEVPMPFILYAMENGLVSINPINSTITSPAISPGSSSVHSVITDMTLSNERRAVDGVNVMNENSKCSFQNELSTLDLPKIDDQTSTSSSSSLVPHRGKRTQRMRYSREEYKCPSCTYSCTTEKAFFSHVRENCEVSSGEPKSSCPICGKDRDTEKLLLAHMHKHRDGKQFCCDLCRFRTLQLKKLIQHRRMHTGEKPHLCPYCTYRSARRDNLRSHVRRVHKKDNLTCDTFTPRTIIIKPKDFKAPEINFK